MLNGKTRGAGGNQILRNIDCKIQRRRSAIKEVSNARRSAIKEVSNARNSIDCCRIPESTNTYLVNANARAEPLTI